MGFSLCDWVSFMVLESMERMLLYFFLPSLTDMLEIRLALAILFIRKINIRTSMRPINSKGWPILSILPHDFEY